MRAPGRGLRGVPLCRERGAAEGPPPVGGLVLLEAPNMRLARWAFPSKSRSLKGWGQGAQASDSAEMPWQGSSSPETALADPLKFPAALQAQGEHLPPSTLANFNLVPTHLLHLLPALSSGGQTQKQQLCLKAPVSRLRESVPAARGLRSWRG